MARIIIDVLDKTKAEIVRTASKNKLTIKDFILGKIGVRDE